MMSCSWFEQETWTTNASLSHRSYQRKAEHTTLHSQSASDTKIQRVKCECATAEIAAVLTSQRFDGSHRIHEQKWLKRKHKYVPVVLDRSNHMLIETTGTKKAGPALHATRNFMRSIQIRGTSIKGKMGRWQFCFCEGSLFCCLMKQKRCKRMCSAANQRPCHWLNTCTKHCRNHSKQTFCCLCACSRCIEHLHVARARAFCVHITQPNAVS